MVEGLNSVQLAEMEAYARIEQDPEGEVARSERLATEARVKAEESKNRFIRASKAAEEAANGNRSNA